jgi:hypothetical protein
MKGVLPELTLPDEYKVVLQGSEKKVTESKSRSPRKDQARPSAPRISKRVDPIISDCESQSSHSTEFHEQVRLEAEFYRILRKKFPLTGDERQDIRHAQQMKQVINAWNAIPTHLNATFRLWNTIKRSLRARLDVRWVSDEELIEMDGISRSGNFTSNERIYNCTIADPSMITGFVSYFSPRDALSEGEVESGSGSVLQKIISGDGITDKRSVFSCLTARQTAHFFLKETASFVFLNILDQEELPQNPTTMLASTLMKSWAGMKILCLSFSLANARRRRHRTNVPECNSP